MTSVKICLENEVRRLLLRGEDGTSLTFHKLINTIYNLFPTLAGKVFTLNWQDDEGDTIVCSSDAELDDAILVMQAKGKLLRFTVHLKGSDAPVKPKLVHANITCDECGVKPIVGIRYKCAIRNDFDLCEACEAKRIQPYPMIKIVEPSQAPQVLIYGLPDGTRNDEGGAPHWPRGWGWRHRGPPGFGGPPCSPPQHGPFPHPFQHPPHPGHGGPHGPHTGHGGPHGPHPGHGGPHGPHGHGHHGGPRRHWGRRWCPADCVPNDNKADVPVAENVVPEEVQLEEELIEKAIMESLAINDSNLAEESKPEVEGSPSASVTVEQVIPVQIEQPKLVQLSTPALSMPTVPTMKLSMKSLKDVTYPDGTIVQPGTTFRKIWRVRNDGSQVWPEGVALVFVGGDAMGIKRVKEFLPAIQPNEEVDVAVSLTAPIGPGMYTAYYRLETKEQSFFGNRLWATVVVSDQDPDWHVVAQKPDSPSPTPAPSVAPSFVTSDATAAVRSEESTAVVEETTLAESIRLDRIEPPTAPVTQSVAHVVQPTVISEPIAPNRAALLLWRRELDILAEMGFADTDIVIPLLQNHLGSPLSLSGDKNARPNAEGMQQVIAALLNLMN